jgi:hypothetical protein
MTSATNSPPAMVFSHPTAEEDAAHATDRRPAEVTRDVAFSTPGGSGAPAAFGDDLAGQWPRPRRHDVARPRQRRPRRPEAPRV